VWTRNPDGSDSYWCGDSAPDWCDARGTRDYILSRYGIRSES
jgi:hypothetical protein